MELKRRLLVTAILVITLSISLFALSATAIDVENGVVKGLNPELSYSYASVTLENCESPTYVKAPSVAVEPSMQYITVFGSSLDAN